ncbi:MAG: exodeoxyribonuclease VII large subunit [Proteobacteria bacterium]|nr:exodeoxyribonuclease VII large subunit [Pseudomonadota bacterium]
MSGASAEDPPSARPLQLLLKARPEPVPEVHASALDEPTVYPVSQLVRLAARCVEASFALVWVEGEVSNLRRPSSGHCYFTLKDAQAQLALVMFRSAAQQLKFRLEDGQQLRCRGRLTIYEGYGRFQLTADHAEPVGLGALQLAFEQLRRKLEAEGLFDPQHKRALPRLPRTIAVVTSPTGAALHDIVRVLHDRCPVRVIVCPTAVQGVEAPAEICAALARADALAADLIIVGRGGGSLEDLWAFNDERVARAIFALRTPVISAVGHEVDVTIADLVADRRAATPSAAAELAVPVLRELRDQLGQWGGRLARAIHQGLQRQRLRLTRLEAGVISPRGLLDRGRMRLDEHSSRLQAAELRLLARGRQRLDHQRQRLGQAHPRTRLARGAGRLQQLLAALTVAAQARLQRDRAVLAGSVATLDALSPLAVLARGYCLLQDDSGTLIRDAASVAVGARVEARLHRGGLVCRIERVCSEAEGSAAGAARGAPGALDRGGSGPL